MSRPISAPGAENTAPAHDPLGRDEPSTYQPGTYDPGTYELCLEGHLDEHWSAWFGSLALTREADGTTTLRGAVADQAELHGLLAKVRDLGATLISVTATRRPSESDRRSDPPLMGGARGV